MIWGVDTATRITGITAGTGETMPAVGAWNFDYCGEDLGQLLDDFDKQLTALATHRGAPTVILYESPILLTAKRRGLPDPDSPDRYSTRGGDKLLPLRKLYSMGAYLELFGRRLGAKVEEASAMRLKKALTGNHLASKADMVAVCRRLGVRLPPGKAAEDAADSFAAWYVGLTHHGRGHLTKWDTAIHSRRGFLT